uniref:Uncharacterized protein n=1 Tax=Arundo donax TaxID=35708 RepID=A0A0A9GBG8_ARUDO
MIPHTLCWAYSSVYIDRSYNCLAYNCGRRLCHGEHTEHTLHRDSVGG